MSLTRRTSGDVTIFELSSTKDVGVLHVAVGNAAKAIAAADAGEDGAPDPQTVPRKFLISLAEITWADAMTDPIFASSAVFDSILRIGNERGQTKLFRPPTSLQGAHEMSDADDASWITSGSEADAVASFA